MLDNQTSISAYLLDLAFLFVVAKQSIPILPPFYKLYPGVAGKASVIKKRRKDIKSQLLFDR